MEIHLDKGLGPNNMMADKIMRDILVYIDKTLSEGIQNESSCFNKVEKEDLVIMLVTNILVNFFCHQLENPDKSKTPLLKRDILYLVSHAFMECAGIREAKAPVEVKH